jgi:hypothetical protein
VATQHILTAAILAAFDALPEPALVKRDIVRALFGNICAFEVDRMEKAGRIPKRVKIGSRVNGWQVGELRAALAARLASRS